VFAALKPLGSLPSLNDIMCYYFGITKFAAFGSPEIVSTFEKLTEIAKFSQKIVEGAARWAEVSTELGYPSVAGALTQAPFDTLSDFMRGTKGAMLDLYRQPDKVLEMTEKLLPMMIKIGLAAKARGNPRVFIPLHKGLDGFMSMDQFKTFYWPTLKRLIEALIEEDCVPCVFWEGNVVSRLELIADIPAGKAVYSFERTDMAKAKSALGGQVCIKGNVPLSLLVAGSPEEVEAYCKNLIETVGKGGGFILDSSTVIDDARAENVRAMFDAARKYGNYS
jgi:uroporphyrinogen-III decarboxylase